MGKIALIMGGVRSGKSRFAQDLAQKLGGDAVLFVATAEAGDGEMSRRIRIHQSTRPATWQTLEAPYRVGEALRHQSPLIATVLIDCLTLLVSNVLLACPEPIDADQAERAVNAEIDALLAACQERTGHVVIVSSEVGLGVVPESRLGRLYRDLLGWANQRVAARAESTYLLVAGLPVELKALAQTVESAAIKLEENRHA
jgi:adenosylcobinamide kinase / adenosylcobinamide-phosphate guanylyltransferase